MPNEASNQGMAINYEAFNDAVNGTYFDGRHRLRPVYLDLEDEHRHELARRLGLEPSDVESALGATVKKTLCWHTSNLYTLHSRSKARWETNGRADPPPFSALLLALSLAAEKMHADTAFSSNNYYQRLADVLLLEETEAASKKTALAQSAKHTAEFWESLNTWLTQHDYAFGEPTADDFNSPFRYVSFAVSQSLIREVDRQRLRVLFSAFGLSRRNKVSAGEMRLCLTSWRSWSNGPTPPLRRMLDNADLLDRLVDTALSELELFDGAVAEEQGKPGNQRLFWVILERIFPRKQMRLHLACADLRSDLGDLEELGAPHKLTGESRRLRFEQRGPADIQFLGPTELLNLERMFYSAVQVRTQQGAVFSHDPNPIILLKRRDDAPYWQEVPRIEPHTTHIVICHERWEARTRDHLNALAEPGFSTIELDADRGFLPSQWVGFRDVIVRRLPSGEVPNDLQVLVPMSSGREIYCTGGLPLARNLWHAKAPPVVHIDADYEPEEIFLERGSGKRHDLDPISYAPHFLREFSGKPLEGKNLRLVAKRSRWRLVQTLSFRSANTPRWLTEEQKTSLGYSIGATPLNLLSAVEVFDQPAIQGHVTHGLVADPAKLAGLARTMRLGAIFQEQDEEEEPDPQYDYSVAEAVEGTCILRGYHYWLVDPTTIRMQCRDCRKFQWVAEFRAEWTRAQRRRQRVRNRGVPIAIPSKVETTFDETARLHEELVDNPGTSIITADMLFDAACYLGGGSMEHLQGLLAHVHRDPLALSNACRALVDLALIDTQLDDNLMRPVRWSIPPPCLTLTSDGRAFLSGYRSDNLISQIDDAMRGFDCSLSCVAQPDLPTAYYWIVEDLSADEIRKLLSNIRDPFARALAVEDHLPIRLIEALPPISAIIASLKPISITATQKVERFDVGSRRWHADTLGEPGAYRTTMYGIQYFFHDGVKSFSAPYELAKLLVARRERHGLHEYEDGAFRCVIGCEPPGLFRRALVACSGILPTKNNGLVTYGCIDENVADAILGKLYG
jgi:hypothetical protein